jgi:phosphotransferase system enzyme I (PtsP)
LRAAAGRDLKIMFPMVSEVDEFRQAKTVVEREIAHLTRHGHELPERLQLGVMIEVPSLLYQLDELYSLVDFASIGSNDLFQFFNAVDRGNTRVAGRFDTMSPAFLRALKEIRDTAERHDTPVTVCGEIAGRPLEAMALAALGYTNLSMSPSALGPVKAMVRALDLGRLRETVLPLLEEPGDLRSLRPALRAFAQETDIPF